MPQSQSSGSEHGLGMEEHADCSRRDFLGKAALLGGAFVLGPASSRRLLAKRRLPCLRVGAAVSSEAPVASRTGEAVSPHGLAMKPSASSSGADDVKNTHRRRKQGSLR